MHRKRRAFDRGLDVRLWINYGEIPGDCVALWVNYVRLFLHTARRRAHRRPTILWKTDARSALGESNLHVVLCMRLRNDLWDNR